MEGIWHFLVGGFIPVMIVIVAIALLVGLKVVVSRYKKIPPGRVGIFYGMKYKQADGSYRGFHIMSGGGRVQRPLIEGYLEILTTSFQVDINEAGIPNKDNVKLTVPGVATCKISTQPENLTKAIEALIDKLTEETKRGNINPIEDFARNILKGHLRSIIGTLDINELLRKRDEFNKQVINESAAELSTFGIDLQNLVIQDIRDDQGYIDALGKQAVADAKAEAEIKIAEAGRRQSIAVSNAEKESKTVQAGNAAEVSAAERDRDIKQAGFKKETETAKAEADMAGEIARATQEQTLRVKQAERDAAAATANIKVQEQEAQRKEKELLVTVIRPAEANREATIINAEAAKRKAIVDAEAEAEVLKTTAEAKKNAATLEGEGEGNKNRSILVAEAQGKAESERATLMAKAEGTKALNDALAQMSDAAKLILVLDRLPGLLKDGGDAGAKIVGAMFGPAAAAIGQIDKITVVDVGGSGNGVSSIAGMVSKNVFEVLTQLKARGFDLTNLLKSLNVDASSFASLLEGISPDNSKPKQLKASAAAENSAAN